MSLLSSLRTRLVSSLNIQALSVKSSPTFIQKSLQSKRQYWREVLRQTPNPKKPSQITFEDPTQMAIRSARAQSAEGLLRRKGKYLRYEKPWMKRKKLKMMSKYRSMERGVNDLKKYVQYVQDGKDVLRGKSVNEEK